MKIGIDARFAGPGGTGIGKYTEKLILNLAKIDRNNQYVLFLNKNNWDFFKIDQKNFKKSLADVTWYSLKEQLLLSTLFNKEKVDLLHIPHFNVPLLYRGNFIVTIHDLIHHHFKEQAVSSKNPILFNIKRLGYKFVINHAIRNSLKIITPSNFVKKELIYYFKLNSAKVTVTHEAAEEEYFSTEATGKNKIRNSILFVGNIYPHKNISNLLEAMSILKNRKKAAKLIIVCPRNIFFQRLLSEINKKDLEGTVEIINYLPTRELVPLFNKITAYVFPSYSEGFGIPGLNAMAAKIPVLASDIPVLKEIYGHAAIYFDPNSAIEIAEKIDKILNDAKTRKEMVEKGNQQVNKYSWGQMAEETLKVYESSK